MSEDKNISAFGIPIDIRRDMMAASSDSLPSKTANRYEKEYADFVLWRTSEGVQCTNEDIMLRYFSHLSSIFSPSSLWTKTSMIKACLKLHESIDISKYDKLFNFLKRNSKFYKPKKAKILSNEQITNFLLYAPDEHFLLEKVILVFGIFGGCRRSDLSNLKTYQIIDTGRSLVVTLEDTKHMTQREFTITEDDTPFKGCELYRKYAALRPADMENQRVFVDYRKGKCTKQLVGMPKIGGVPRRIAEYLQLENCGEYTVHCFRRSAATLLTESPGDFLYHDCGIPPDAREEAPTIPLPEMKTYSRTHQMGESSSFQNFEEINESSSALSDDDNTNEEYSMSEACFDTPLETKVQELIEVSDTQVIAKPEIVTEPEYTANEKKVEFPTANECASFGEYIAKNLQQLPLAVALKLQSKIHELVMESRLEYVRQNPHAEAPVIVKEEFVPVTEDEPTNETITREIPPEPSETGKAKRQRETDPPDPSKRPKRNHPDSTMTDPANTQRIDVDVFAKHIKEQLVKLPEDISVKLQTDIYTMIMQAKTKNLTGDNGIQGRAVRIKTEIDEDQADFIDGYDLLSN